MRRALLRTCLLLAAALAPVAIGQTTPATGTAQHRIGIVLEADERERMLAGMRGYLESLHAIIAALASNRTEPVADAAKRSGAAMLLEVSPVTALKLPPAFVSMSFDTHDKFDRLAAKASRPTSRTELLQDLGAITANCTACHATFRMQRSQ